MVQGRSPSTCRRATRWRATCTPAAPGAPHLSERVEPERERRLQARAGHATQAATRPAYTLQHKNASGGWRHRRQRSDEPRILLHGRQPRGRRNLELPRHREQRRPRANRRKQSAAVVVDKTAPNSPSASADRAPDYAGGGGWFKDTVTVSFTDNGDPALSDGSPGSGVNPSSLSSPQTFSTDGSHEASGTVADNVGNVSAPGSLTVQVDVTAPSVRSRPAWRSGIRGHLRRRDRAASDGNPELGAIRAARAGRHEQSRREHHERHRDRQRRPRNDRFCVTNVELESSGAPFVSAWSNPNKEGCSRCRGRAPTR